MLSTFTGTFYFPRLARSLFGLLAITDHMSAYRQM